MEHPAIPDELLAEMALVNLDMRRVHQYEVHYHDDARARGGFHSTQTFLAHADMRNALARIVTVDVRWWPFYTAGEAADGQEQQVAVMAPSLYNGKWVVWEGRPEACWDGRAALTEDAATAARWLVDLAVRRQQEARKLYLRTTEGSAP